MGNVHFIDIPTKTNNLSDIWKNDIDLYDKKIDTLAIVLARLLNGSNLGLNPKFDYIFLECKTNEYATTFYELLCHHPSYVDLDILLNDPKTCEIRKYVSGNTLNPGYFDTTIKIGITLRPKKEVIVEKIKVKKEESIETNNGWITIDTSYGTRVSEPLELSYSIKIE